MNFFRRKRGFGPKYCALCRLPLGNISPDFTCISVSHGSGYAVCKDCKSTAEAINKITIGYFIMRSHIENGYPSPLPDDCEKGGQWLKNACEMNNCWDERMDLPARRIQNEP